MSKIGVSKLGPAATAVLLQGERRWMGRLAPPITGGPPQLAFSLEGGPGKLPFGSVVHLEVTAPRSESARSSSARLTAVAYLPSVLLVEVDAENPSLWTEAMPGDIGNPADQRQWPRLFPPATDPGPVPVDLEVGPPSARRFAARVVDRSAEGVGLRFVLQAEPFLCRAPRFVCHLPEGPDGFASGAHWVRVRHRRLLSTGVRYGLSIDGPVAASQAANHEAQWTCLECSEQPLLADHHRHCPACGAGRGNAPSRLPDWDAGIATSHHRFSGIGRTCLRCGCAWDEEARNCGHCGTRLPVDQVRPG